MAEVTQQQVVEYIKGISVLELSQLVKTLESELGVSAAAAMPMMAMRGGAAASPAERNRLHGDITELGVNKINVIKVVPSGTSLGPQESKTDRRGSPKPIKEGIPRNRPLPQE